MKILITSGGTREAIDEVRSITNHSTGRLGSQIAQTFLRAGHSVTLITTDQATKPESHPLLTLLLIQSTADLEQILSQEVPHHDALIHSMAVSDYRPVQMISLEEVEKADSLQAYLNQSAQKGKISSSPDHQVLFLEKTPKLISMVKDWNPHIILVGFKLLVSVSSQELLEVARQSLEKNHLDLIVANDLSQIKQDQHPAYLMNQKMLLQVQTKEEIAYKLLKFVEEA